VRWEWLGVAEGNGDAGRKGNEMTGGAHESAVGERRGGLVKCATTRRKRNPAVMPRHFGPTGPVKEAMGCGWRAGRTLVEIQMGI
jgi:hypothetical protein